MTRESETPLDGDPEAWLDAIAGRTTTGQSPIEAKEADRLRLAMRELDDETVANSKLDHDWQQLRFRLRREGISGNRNRPSGVYWALAATLILTASIGLWPLNQPDVPELSVMRGKPGFVKVLRTDMPEALMANILGACNKSHVTCSQRQDASGTSLVSMPPMTEPAPPGFKEALQALGIDDLPAEEKITLIVTRRN